jgi:hypothetical protein
MPITVAGTTITFNDATTISTQPVTSWNGLAGAVANTTQFTIGCFVIARPQNTTNYNPGDTIAGSSLYVCSTATVYYSSQWYQIFVNATYTPSTIGSGSWRCVSRAYAAGVQGDPGLWVRYA